MLKLQKRAFKDHGGIDDQQQKKETALIFIPLIFRLWWVLILIITAGLLSVQAQEMISPRYIPCGAGGVAICDLQTGLMWETKTEAPAEGSGSCAAPLALHGVDLSCTPEEAQTVWLPALNLEGGSGYAGYTDWRVPHIQELLTIFDYEAESIDPAFGPTETTSGGLYISSTPHSTLNDAIWLMRFEDGRPQTGGRGHTRAVRGGHLPAETTLRYIPCGAEEIAVCDLETGLMWEVKCGGGIECPDSPVRHTAHAEFRHDQEIGPWLDEVNAENGNGYAGYTDWRLPTIQELLTIFDYDVLNDTDPTLGASASGLFWSSTPTPSTVSDRFWAALFGGRARSGSVLADSASSRNFARAVRGGR